MKKRPNDPPRFAKTHPCRTSTRAWHGCLAAALIACALFFLAIPASNARSDPRIGRAEKVVLDVRAVMPEAERRLVVNEDVFRDDVITTKARSAARLVFHDETYLSIGPESRVRLANLPAARDDGEPFVVDAAKGVFKFVSGRLRSERYQIKTPAATIGVRGTIVWMTVREDGVTEVASQDGEVTVCAQGDCVTLQPGEYSRAEPGAPPTPPAEVPADFYAQIRDMLIRLLMASEEFGIGFGSGGGGSDTAAAAGAAGAREGRGPAAISGLGPRARSGRDGREAPAAGLPDGPTGPTGPDPGGPVSVSGPATLSMLLVGLAVLIILSGPTRQIIHRAGLPRRRRS